MAKPKITVVGSFAVGLTIRAPNIPVFGVVKGDRVVYAHEEDMAGDKVVRVKMKQ